MPTGISLGKCAGDLQRVLLGWVMGRPLVQRPFSNCRRGGREVYSAGYWREPNADTHFLRLTGQGTAG